MKTPVVKREFVKQPTLFWQLQQIDLLHVFTFYVFMFHVSHALD